MPLRDVFIYIALIALALAGMKIGGILASLIVFLVLLVYSFRLIVAFIGTSVERQTAIGFVIPATTYAFVLASVGSDEFGTTSPHLFTSQLAALAVETLSNKMASRWEIMSLFHTIAIIALGAIGSFFAHETSRLRDRDECSAAVKHFGSDPINRSGELGDQNEGSSTTGSLPTQQLGLRNTNDPQ